MAVTLAQVAERLELADDLAAGRPRMFEPQDLPGRYGRVVRAIDHVLAAMHGEAVVAGGWAVWRHGYLGRVTQDVDVVLPAAQLDEFLRVASVSGFDLLPVQPGRWPKLSHKETGVRVDILPEGERPGTSQKPAPTTIPHPRVLGAKGSELRYISFPALTELKLAAGRARDEADVIELIRANPGAIEAVRKHLAGVHADYVVAFDLLIQRAIEQQERD
jgi:hypothetical protein